MATSTGRSAGYIDLIHRAMNTAGKFVTDGGDETGAAYFANWTSNHGTAGEFLEVRHFPRDFVCFS